MVNNLLKWVAIATLIYLSYYVSTKPERIAAREAKKARIEPPLIKSYKTIRGYDYSHGGYIEYNDDELRALRDDNPDYIIKIQGRIVKPKKEQTRIDIEEWMDDNQEYYEMYRIKPEDDQDF